jgi:hypothetical protein
MKSLTDWVMIFMLVMQAVLALGYLAQGKSNAVLYWVGAFILNIGVWRGLGQ